MTLVQKWTFLYGAAVHALTLVGCVVLVAVGRATWEQLGPFITGLVGLGIGVPLVVNGTAAPAPQGPVAQTTAPPTTP